MPILYQLLNMEQCSFDINLPVFHLVKGIRCLNMKHTMFYRYCHTKTSLHCLFLFLLVLLKPAPLPFSAGIPVIQVIIIIAYFSNLQPADSRKLLFSVTVRSSDMKPDTASLIILSPLRLQRRLRSASGIRYRTAGSE